MKVLITGGAGYIGSTIASCCHDSGIPPVILDDYSTGLRVFAERFDNYEGDIADTALLNTIFDEHPDIEAVIHCAAKIIVPESVEQPLEYYDVNVGRATTMLQVLRDRGVKRMMLSSTAAMYAPDADFTVNESSTVAPTSPYAASKWMLERVMADAAAAGQIQAIALRYFNPIGADPKMRTGLQNPLPTHALGKMITCHQNGEPFTVTGVDWPTRDGSGLRDYVHVWDLARAHVAALKAELAPYEVINLGTGTGTTVFELVEAFNEVVDTPLEVKTAPPRVGDVAGCAPRIDKAERLLGWKPEFSITQGVRDSLAWAQKLPEVLG